MDSTNTPTGSTTRRRRYPNMDIVRYYLAIAVFMAHFGEAAGVEIWWPTSSFNAVGGFFALSGFLLYSSCMNRKSDAAFLWNRCRRIMPPYIFIVLLCAFGMAAISTLPLGEYLTSADTWKYLAANLSFLNFLHPTLPGVLDGNPINGSLWTMKVEWALYLSLLPFCWIVTRRSANPARLAIAVYVVSAIYRVSMQHLLTITENPIYEILSRQFMGQLMYFYSGVLIYLYRDFFLSHKAWVIVAGLVALCLEPFVGYLHIIVTPLALASRVILISIWGDWGRWLSSRADLSYAIYLFHLPIILTIIYFGAIEQIGIIGTFIVTAAATTLLALFSWRFIESPFRRRPAN